jgi:hypothetical protein
VFDSKSFRQIFIGSCPIQSHRDSYRLLIPDYLYGEIFLEFLLTFILTLFADWLVVDDGSFAVIVTLFIFSLREFIFSRSVPLGDFLVVVLLPS